MDINFLVIKRPDDSEAHFHKGGTLLVRNDLNLPGHGTLPAGDYAIVGVGGDSIEIALDGGTLEIARENLADTVALIPSEVRSASHNCEWVAPFHLRDDIDEALDELPANVNQERLRHLFGENEFRSHQTAYAFAELIADGGDYDYIQVVNGYGNTVEMVEMVGIRLTPGEIEELENQIVAACGESPVAAAA